MRDSRAQLMAMSLLAAVAVYPTRLVAQALTIPAHVTAIQCMGWGTPGDCQPHAYVCIGYSPPYIPANTFVNGNVPLGSNHQWPYFQDASLRYWVINEDKIDPRYLGGKSDYVNSAYANIAAGTPGTLTFGSVGALVTYALSSGDVGKYFGATNAGAPSFAWKYVRFTEQPANGDSIVLSQVAQSAQTGTGNGAAIIAYSGKTLVTGNYTLTCTTAGGTGVAVFSVVDPNSSNLGNATAGTAFSSAEINLTVQAGDMPFAVGDTITLTCAGCAAAFGSTASATTIVNSSGMNTLANNFVAWLGTYFAGVGVTASITDTAYNEVLLQTTATGAAANLWTIQYYTAAGLPNLGNHIISPRNKYFEGGCAQGDLLAKIASVSGSTATLSIWNTGTQTYTTAAAAPATVYGYNEGATAGGFTGYILGNILYVTGINFGAVQVNAWINGSTTSGMIPKTWIWQQISGTPGGVGKYLVQQTQAVASAAAPSTFSQNGWSQASFGTDNFNAIQNAVSWCAAAFAGATYNSIIGGANTSANNQELGGQGSRRVVIRSHPTSNQYVPGNAFGVLQPILLPFGVDMEFEGDAEIAALPGFAGGADYPQPNLGGRYAVLQGPFGGSGGGPSGTTATNPTYTGYAWSYNGYPLTQGRLINPRVSCWFNWAQRAVWLPTFNFFQIQGRFRHNGGRRGLLLGYKKENSTGSPGAGYNSNSIYTDKIISYNAAYYAPPKTSLEDIAVHIDFGVTDCIIGDMIGGFPNPAEDNGSVNQWGDIHYYQGIQTTVTGFVAVGGNATTVKRVYQDNAGSNFQIDPPMSYTYIFGGGVQCAVDRMSYNASLTASGTVYPLTTFYLAGYNYLRVGRFDEPAGYGGQPLVKNLVGGPNASLTSGLAYVFFDNNPQVNGSNLYEGAIFPGAFWGNYVNPWWNNVLFPVQPLTGYNASYPNLTPGANIAITASGATPILPNYAPVGTECVIHDTAGHFASWNNVYVQTADGSTVNGTAGATGVLLATANAMYRIIKVTASNWRVHVIA